MKYVQEERQGKKEVHPKGSQRVKVGKTEQKVAEEGGEWVSWRARKGSAQLGALGRQELTRS